MIGNEWPPHCFIARSHVVPSHKYGADHASGQQGEFRRIMILRAGVASA